MKTVNLAKIFEIKYNLKSEAASPGQIVDEAKKEIILAYKYHFSDTAKEPVLQLVATQYDEPWSKKLIKSMIDLVGNLDSYDPAEIFIKVNKILGDIDEYKNDPDKKVRNFIHDAVKINRQSDKNYRELVKSKFETALKRVSGLLEKSANKLKAFLPKDVPLAGGTIEQQRKELSRDKLRNFMMTPIAKSYGLDNMELMTKILEDLDLRQKLTTIINAIDRGHKPVDGPEIVKEVSLLVSLIQQKQTNIPYFESGQEPPKEISPEELAYLKVLKEKRKEDKEEETQKERSGLMPLIQKRDDAHRQKLIEEDRARHISSEGVFKILDKLLLKGIYENS